MLLVLLVVLVFLFSLKSAHMTGNDESEMTISGGVHLKLYFKIYIIIPVKLASVEVKLMSVLWLSGHTWFLHNTFSTLHSTALRALCDRSNTSSLLVVFGETSLFYMFDRMMGVHL